MTRVELRVFLLEWEYFHIKAAKLLDVKVKSLGTGSGF